MRTVWTPALGLALVLAPAALPGEDRPWIEVKTPRFTVVSQSGEKAARDLAWQFEQVHSVFSRAYPWAKLESGRPFVVLAVRNENALRALSPQFWDKWKMRPAAAFVSAAGRDFVGIRTDLDGASDATENPYSTAYEGYVSIVLEASFPGELPFWFDEGLQEFFGNTLVREKDVHIGRLIKRHLDVLGRTSRFTLAELMAIGSDSREFRQEADRQVFEAQAWLLVHYLFFGEDGANLAKLNRYADLLRAGRPAPAAFREALGDPAVLEKGLSLYLSRRLYRYTQLNLDVNVDRASFRARSMETAEATAMRAAFLLAMREPPAEARALADSALKADPRQPLAHEVLGLAADRDQRADEARSELGLAVDNGSQSYWAHYRLAQLLWKPDNDRATLERIAKLLETSCALNPDHPWSHRSLADTRSSLERADALEPARRAVTLAPGEALHRVTLAAVLVRLGELDAAQHEGGRALALAADEDRKRQARDILAWVARKKEAAAAPAPAVVPDAPSAPTATQTAGGASDAGDEGGRTIARGKHPCETNDRKRCADWLAAAEQACASGSLEACSSAGWAYSGAPGVPQDPARATRLLEKACSGGRHDGCVNLAVNLANRQTPESLDRALEVLERSCKGGYRQACGLQESIKARRRR